MGPAAGAAVYSPALTDFIIMEKGVGQMYITGPDVIKTVTGEEVTHEQLGGADAHTTMSGVAHFGTDVEEESLDLARDLLSFLPSNNLEDSTFADTADNPSRPTPELMDLVPEDPNQPYDM